MVQCLLWKVITGHDFEDLYWVQYDRMYRCQVANHKIYTLGYNKCFAGEACHQAMCIHFLREMEAELK